VLIAHERDERRDDHGHPWQQQRGKLVAERLPCSRRHDSHGVPSGHDRFDHGLLTGPECIETEDLLERLLKPLRGDLAARDGAGSRRSGGGLPWPSA
jgi:hypothetical protein